MKHILSGCNCHYLVKHRLGVASDIELVRLAIKLDVLHLLELFPNPQVGRVVQD